MEQNITNGQPISQLPNFFSLAGDTLKTYRNKFKFILGVSLCHYASFAAIAIVGMTIATVFGITADASKNLSAIIAAGCLIALAGAALIAIIFSWISAALIVGLRDRNESLGLREIFKRARPYAIPSLWVSILAIPVMIFGYVFFIIPGIIFSIWFTFSRYIVITDGLKGAAALAKSREFGRNHFWSILLLGLLGILSALFIDSLAQSISQGLGSPIGNIFNLFFGFMFFPVSTIYYYLIFENLKRIKGDTIATPTVNQKNFVATIAVLGTIITIVIAGLLIYFAPQIKTQYEIEVKKNMPAPMIHEQVPAQNLN
jgi:hypothetical protein